MTAMLRRALPAAMALLVLGGCEIEEGGPGGRLLDEPAGQPERAEPEQAEPRDAAAQRDEAAQPRPEPAAQREAIEQAEPEQTRQRDERAQPEPEDETFRQ